MTKWPLSHLGSILTAVSRPENVNPDSTYDTLGVKWYGGGLFHREPISGREIKAKRLYKVAAGDFVYNRLFAWKGSFALASHEHNDAYVSNEFPCFRVDDSRVHPHFLKWFTLTRSFWNAVTDLSTGSSRQSRLRLKEERFLMMQLPLPPMAEQIRIVDKIESVVPRVFEVRRLRERIEKERDELLWTMAHGGSWSDEEKERRGWHRVALDEVLKLGCKPCRVEKTKAYPNIGMYSFGRGAFVKPDLNGAELKATTLYQVKAGQFIYAKLCAFEGTFGYVPPEADGAYVSNEFPAFDCNPDRVSAIYLFCYFKAQHVWDTLDKTIRGFGGRRFRLKPEHLLAYKLWLPPMAYQSSVVRLFEYNQRLQQVQAVVAKELDDLVPALLDQAFRGEL